MAAPLASSAQTIPASTDARAAQVSESIESAQRARLDAAMARWQSSMDAFAAADLKQAPVTGGIVFVGSSSIRLWDNLETQFGEASHVMKRGFGGSRLSDCASLVSRLVVPYAPRLVVVYAGDNDLAEGDSPEQVAASFARFVEGVRATLPATRIAYVSIKPSPSRIALKDKILATNGLIARHAARTSNLDYIDIHTPMLDAAGQPRPELFRGDALHLNDQGYALWRGIIASHLAPAGAVTTAAGAADASIAALPVLRAGPAPR